MQGALVRRCPVFLLPLQMIMPRLHLFNPENDIALAVGSDNFTAPKAALALRNAGAALPLWYGDQGDAVLAYGINARWLDSVRERFGIGVGVFDHRSADSFEASPWGWSAAVRRDFVREGFAPDRLPDDSLISQWRLLSHRRTAAELCRMIAPQLDFAIAPPAAEIKSSDELTRYLADNQPSIIKSPWSSSGRGLIDTRRVTAAEAVRRSEGIIRRQGSVMVETAYERAADFAMLFRCADGRCQSVGLSLFTADATGSYTGNMLAPDSRLLEILDSVYPARRIIEAGEALRKAIEQLIAPCYSGPLGVDMLIARLADGTAMLDATVELNLRMTMGFVAHSLSERFLAPGSEGRFSVAPQNNSPAPDDLVIENRRMVSGRINLTPPGGLFSFTAETAVL